MQISYEDDVSDDLETEDLAPAFNILVALVLRRDLQGLKGHSKTEIEALAERLTFSLATMFDEDTIKISGKEYHPRVAFTKDDDLLKGAGDFDFLHEYAASLFDDLDDLDIADD